MDETKPPTTRAIQKRAATNKGKLRAKSQRLVLPRASLIHGSIRFDDL